MSGEDWSGSINSGLIGAVIAPFLLLLLVLAAKRPPRERDDWHYLPASAGMVLIGVLMLGGGAAFMFVFFLFGYQLAIGMGTVDDRGIDLLFALSLQPFAILMLQAPFHVFLVRVRFNAERVERLSPQGDVSWSWSEIARIAEHPIWGVRVHHRSGPKVLVWRIRRGFDAFLAEARGRNIPITISDGTDDFDGGGGLDGGGGD